MERRPLPPLDARDLAHACGLVDRAAWDRLRRGRVFLTGGTGFVGKWMLATLLEANRQYELACEVSVLSRNPQVFADQVPDLARSPWLRLIAGDIRDFPFPTLPFDCVIHAATDVVAVQSPLETFATCLDGTRRALDFAVHAGASDFLLLSSGAVYGRQPPALARLREDDRGGPDSLAGASAYGLGKRCAEWLTTVYAQEHGLRVRIARGFAFVGPYLPLDRHFAVGNFLRDALADAPIVIQGDGTPWRSYLHAADMAGWLWAILLRGAPGGAFNVGGPEALTIADLAQRVVAATGSRSRVTRLREPVAGAPAERYLPCLERIETALALPPALPLDEAIRRTADWHRGRHPA